MPANARCCWNVQPGCPTATADQRWRPDGRAHVERVGAHDSSGRCCSAFKTEPRLARRPGFWQASSTSGSFRVRWNSNKTEPEAIALRDGLVFRASCDHPDAVRPHFGVGSKKRGAPHVRKSPLSPNEPRANPIGVSASSGSQQALLAMPPTAILRGPSKLRSPSRQTLVRRLEEAIRNRRGSHVRVELLPDRDD